MRVFDFLQVRCPMVVLSRIFESSLPTAPPLSFISPRVQIKQHRNRLDHSNIVSFLNNLWSYRASWLFLPAAGVQLLSFIQRCRALLRISVRIRALVTHNPWNHRCSLSHNLYSDWNLPWCMSVGLHMKAMHHRPGNQLEFSLSHSLLFTE